MSKKNGNGRSHIPCIINRASLERTDYVFVVIEDLLNTPPLAAWVPRSDIRVVEQGIEGDELIALLTVEVRERKNETTIVEFDNKGTPQQVALRSTFVTA